MSTSPESEQPVEKKQSGIVKWIAFTSIILATFLEMLDMSLLHVALPKLANVLNSSTEDIEWVATAYTLASAVISPLGGFLAARYGYKRIVLISVAAFVLTSTLCGFAWSDTSLIIFRILQGLGGGLIIPVGMAMVYIIMDRSEVPAALGIWGVASMAAPALGPTVGGYIVEHMHWSTLFFINIPIGLLSLLIGVLLLKETPKNSNLKFDFPGIILSAIFFGILLLIFNKGESEGWTSFYIVSLYWVAFSSGMLLLWVETGKEDPVLNLRLLKNKEFTSSLIIGSVLFVVIQGGSYLFPQWYQNVQGMTPMHAGTELMPQAIAMACVMPFVGVFANRIGIYPVGLTGLAMLIYGSYKLHFMPGYISAEEMNVYLCVRGVGIGLCMMPVMSAGMNALSNEEMGSGSSLSSIIRNVASSFGIAILTSLMLRHTKTYNSVISEQITDPTSPTLSAFQDQVVGRYLALGADVSSSTDGAMGVLAQLIQKEAMVRGLTDAFFIMFLLAVVCLPLLFLMKNKSGREGGENTMMH